MVQWMRGRRECLCIVRSCKDSRLRREYCVIFSRFQLLYMACWWVCGSSRFVGQSKQRETFCLAHKKVFFDEITRWKLVCWANKAQELWCVSACWDLNCEGKKVCDAIFSRSIKSIGKIWIFNRIKFIHQLSPTMNRSLCRSPPALARA